MSLKSSKNRRRNHLPRLPKPQIKPIKAKLKSFIFTCNSSKINQHSCRFSITLYWELINLSDWKQLKKVTQNHWIEDKTSEKNNHQLKRTLERTKHHKIILTSVEQKVFWDLKEPYSSSLFNKFHLNSTRNSKWWKHKNNYQGFRVNIAINICLRCTKSS